MARNNSTFILSRRCLNTDLWNNMLDINLKNQIEEYWFKKLKSKNLFDKNSSKEKYYILSMFPYPSGNLHMGHVRVYTIGDTVARFHRMTGKNVFQPMGWDAFGLPAENAAFEHNISPSVWTTQNVAQMKAQLEKLACSFDWNHEIITCSPQYYKWTQYIFLKLYEAGLAYRKEALVNWDPVDETVLADEQVDENGCSWRSGAKVEKKALKQWFIKTTRFSKNLYDGLADESLVDWKDIVSLQRNWIGICDGYSFDFEIHSSNDKFKGNFLNIWTQHPERIAIAEFIVISPGNILDIYADDGIPGDERKLSSIQAINPFTKSLLPIFVSKNVDFPPDRDSYLGVPSIFSEDERFLIIMKSRLRKFDKKKEHIDAEYICKRALEMNIGGYPVSSKLKDWLISRQRYWGTPIPIIHCTQCGPQPVPYSNLPVTLPVLTETYRFRKGISALKTIPEWLNTKCPKCGKDAVRETDTMDTFVDSSWYYLRYLDPENEFEPFSKENANHTMPVDIYVGGKEHAVLHLYYARFMCHFLHSIGLVNRPEPFSRLLTQGMVMGKTYKNDQGMYLKPEQVTQKGKKKLIEKETGNPVTVCWEKMSKSKFNGVEPSDVFKEYGVDTTRLIMLFSAAPFSHRLWSSDLFHDVLLWQHRMWLTIAEFLNVRSNLLDPSQPHIDPEEEERKLFDTGSLHIKITTYEYNVTHQLAAAISSIQQLTSILRGSPRMIRKYSKIYEKVLAAHIIMLAPMAPHFSATLWFGFNSAPGRLNTQEESGIVWDEDVFNQNWPQLDTNYTVPFLCLINNELYGEVYAPRNVLLRLNNESAMSLASQHPDVKKLINSSEIKNVHFENNLNGEAKINITLS